MTSLAVMVTESSRAVLRAARRPVHPRVTPRSRRVALRSPVGVVADRQVRRCGPRTHHGSFRSLRFGPRCRGFLVQLDDRVGQPVEVAFQPGDEVRGIATTQVVSEEPDVDGASGMVTRTSSSMVVIPLACTASPPSVPIWAVGPLVSAGSGRAVAARRVGGAGRRRRAWCGWCRRRS
jgi:hypothetical protein